MKKSILAGTLSVLLALGGTAVGVAATTAPVNAEKVASLANSIEAAVRATIAATGTADPGALQAAVEQVLESQLGAAQPTAAEAQAALTEVETRLRAAGLFTPPVEAAFRTARSAVAQLDVGGPGAGPNGGSTPLGAPPPVSGGGGSQTGTYAQPQT